MGIIANNAQQVRQRIRNACEAAGRNVESVTLLAVSKTQRAEAVREAIDAGLTCFGENYVAEGVDKIDALADRRVQWHLIGPLQSNKTRAAAEAFQWVHTIDRAKVAQRLSEQRHASLPPLNVCVQVNISGEASKGGVAPGEALALARDVAALPRLKLRGLMAIPEAADTLEAQRAPHRAMRELFDRLRAEGLAIDTLSIGMSADLEAAILEGATLVRVGTAIFGARPAQSSGLK